MATASATMDDAKNSAKNGGKNATKNGAKYAPKPGPGIKLTDEQLRARRARSIAIAVALGVLAVLFYIVTLVKGPGALVRPL